jgi:Bacterial regulatory proteins, luxR family
MSSTADEGSRSLFNVGLPRTDWFTAALAEWHVLGFEGLLGPLGGARCGCRQGVGVATNRAARGRHMDAERHAGVRVDRGCKCRRGHCVAARTGGGGLRRWNRPRVQPVTPAQAFAASSPSRSSRSKASSPSSNCDPQAGFAISDTLTRVLESVGREVGAFFKVRPCLPDDTGLSARELEVLELVAEGLSAADIAARLVLSPETIRTHISKPPRQARPRRPRVRGRQGDARGTDPVTRRP